MRDCNGFSLIELLIVVIILGIITAVVVPNFLSSDPTAVQLLSSRLVDALRYASSEAIRSGQVHGIHINQVTQRVIVYKADTTTNPVSMNPVLTHPINKKNYDLDIKTMPFAKDVRISNGLDVFLFVTFGRNKDVLFDKTGTPFWKAGTNSYRLSSGQIVLNHHQHQSIINIDPHTGRVSTP